MGNFLGPFGTDDRERFGRFLFTHGRHLKAYYFFTATRNFFVLSYDRKSGWNARGANHKGCILVLFESCS